METESKIESRNDPATRSGQDTLRWRRRNSYYYAWLAQIYRFCVRPGSRVLDLGCECGDLLASVEPSHGVGIDPDGQAITLARERFPHLEFHQMDPHKLSLNGQFDYILICNAIGRWHDVQEVLNRIRPLAHEDTRIVITYYNYLWETILRLGSLLRLRRPCGYQNWLPRRVIGDLLDLANFETVRSSSHMLLPKRIPPLTRFFNFFLSPLPGFRLFNLVNCVVARPKPSPKDEKDLSVSVIVPCKDERGNIGPAIQRIPQMGKWTEIIFVDGNSTDGTAEEIESQMRKHPDRNVSLILQGDGVGKGDAVRKGFAAARGDVLVIQDADLTVDPEDLPKFFNALREGKGEFINGSRLVYPMEKLAMRSLNLIANKLFSVLFSYLLGQQFRDTLCGTKMISKKDYEIVAANRQFFGKIDPFGDFDLIFGASKQNLKIAEIPVNYRARRYGDTSISRFRHGWLLLRMSCLAFRKLKWLGRSPLRKECQ